MYVTAHRVKRNGNEGINSFAHKHGLDYHWPDDAASLPDDDPGHEVESLRHIELAPGGNRVRAYLDVVAKDGTEWELVEGALDLLRRDLDQRTNPTIFTHQGVTIRFGVEFGLGAQRGAELQVLTGYVKKGWQGCLNDK